jgi:hypothetical protein
MSRLRNTLFRSIMTGLLALLSACASTTMQSVERAPDFDSPRIRKALVVSLASTPEIRNLVEDEFVRQWKERGVNAVASYAVLPPNVTLDKAGVAPFAKAHGFDAVLVNRLVKREAIDRSVHVHQIGESAIEEPPRMTNYFEAVVASPEYPIPYEVAVLTTNVYDVATEKKIWSGISQTLVTGDVPKRIRPFVETILNNLYKQG